MSSNTKPDTWFNFIQANPEKDKLCLLMPEMPGKFTWNTDPDSNFKLLESSPSSVLLSFDNVSNRLTPSFHHHSIGNALIDNETTFFGLSGFDREATAITFSRKLFSSFKSEKVSIPSLSDIISNGPSAMGSDKGRVELPRFTIVPPVLIEACLVDDPIPSIVLGKSISILEMNKDSINDIFKNIIRSDLLNLNSTIEQPLSDDEIENQITDDKIDKLFDQSFTPYFQFLWSTCIDTLNDKFVPTFSPPLFKPSILEKVKQLHRDCLSHHEDSPATTDSTLSMEKIQSIIESTTAAVMKSISLSTKEHRLPLAAEEKEDKKSKAFSNLDSTKKNLILNLHSDGAIIPVIPCQTCLEILNGKSGPNVASYFTNQFIDEDFAISKGMCHNLGHGHVFSSSPFEIKNVSIFFVHIRSSNLIPKIEQEELFTIELLNKSNSLSRSDTSEIMKNDLYIATDYHTFLQQTMNHRLVWKLFLGEDSYLHCSLLSFEKHIKENADSYREQIASNAKFIVSILNDIHFRLNKFFTSCAKAKSIEDISFNYICFNDITNKIDMRSYSATSPVWYERILANSDNKSSSSKRSSSGSSSGSSRSKRTPEENTNVDSSCKLRENEVFGTLFNKNALENLQPLPKVQNTHICLKYHVTGKCHSNCFRKITHIPLSNDHLISLRRFVRDARNLASNNSNSSNSRNQSSRPNFRSNQSSQGNNSTDSNTPPQGERSG